MLVVAQLSGCGGETGPSAAPGDKDAGADACRPGESPLDGGRCLAAGMQENGCAAGEVGVEGGSNGGGSCRPAGIPHELCGTGFEPDGANGCTPILPPGPCPKAQMAVPGETMCREVAPCGMGTWGDVPVEADTEYVDASYSGGSSDGTVGKPWTTIQVGIDAAAPGAIVAVAAGKYGEDVLIQGHAVRLWGRCPAMVDIVGTGAELAAVSVETGAAGSEVRDLALTGATDGLLLSGSEDVVVDRVWIHETSNRGINVQGTLGPTRIAVMRSLVEAATDQGIFIAGSDAALEATVVRDTRPRANQTFGGGIAVLADMGRRGSVTIRSSVAEQNRTHGVLVAGSDATIESTVVRGTQPQASDQASGRGIGIQGDAGQSARVTIRSSVVDQNCDVGVYISGSEATIESTVVRGTRPQASDQRFGWGIGVQESDACQCATLTLRSSVVDQNHEIGVVVGGADATIESTVVRRTQPRAFDQGFGRGIQIQGRMGRRASVAVRSSVVDENRESGVVVSGSDATIESTVVRDTQPRASDQETGGGITVQADSKTKERASATIRTSVVEQNRDIGISVFSSDATVDRTVVRDTQPRASDGAFGDGVAAWALEGPAGAVVTASRIDHSARAGVSSFGASATLGATVLECNAIDLDGEVYAGSPSWADQGGNMCGCAGHPVACKVTSSNLAPPEALPEPEPQP